MKEIWQFFFVHLYISQCMDFGKKKTKLGADFSHFYSTWENCVNWIFLKFTSHLFPIFFIILSLMVLGDESSLQAQNWPCSFNWFLGWQYKKEATKKYCLKNILTQIERKLVLTLRLVSMLEKAMAPHSRTLAWKIPWTEEPGRLQSRGLRRVGHHCWTRLSYFAFTCHFHALEKEMATHSSVLAWRIPGTGEPGGLPSMGSHRVGHDWSDLAAAVAAAA